MKKVRGLGVKPKVEHLGIRAETWTDGKEHIVSAYRGVDRKYWIRFSPNFGFRFRGFQWSKAHGRDRRVS